MRVQLRGAAPGLYKLFTLHPVCDIIPKTRRARARPIRAYAHTCVHSAREDARARARSRMHAHRFEHFVPAAYPRMPVFYPVYPQSHRAGNTMGGGKARHTPPEGGENSLKIPNVYSYNLHVIISDMPARRDVLCVRLCTDHVHDRMYVRTYVCMYSYSGIHKETRERSASSTSGSPVGVRVRLECPSRFISSAF